MRWFRAVVVAAVIATVVITWPLWSWRESPPLLPVVVLPNVALGLPLIVAALCALWIPRAGAAAMTVLLVYGMLADQTRMQPELFSLPLLLWGTLPGAGARLIARAHLISLWFFAGLHKILSPDFLTDAGPRLVTWTPLALSERAAQLAAVGIIALELGTAILALAPSTRRIAAWFALALHAGILLALSPIGAERNEAVWPWNVALACSGFALIAPWKGRPLASFMNAPSASRAVAFILIVAPLGFYAGVTDAYPAHHLYSAATAQATVYCPSGCRDVQDVNATWHLLHVPLPPEPRLFQAQFQATCAAGDVLRIVSPRAALWAQQESEEVISCRAGALPAAHP